MIQIRPVRPGEAEVVLGFIRGLADYEKCLADVDATAAGLDTALFGPSPRVFCDIAERDGVPAGMALWFYNFSTQRGRHGLYLEDLFVLPEHRGRGIGKALLAHLARRCRDEGLPRLDWSVLDWNSEAIGFYEALGARLKEDARSCRLDGLELLALAGENE